MYIVIILTTPTLQFRAYYTLYKAGFTTAQNLAIGELTMQQLHMLHYTFLHVFTTAQIVINCTLKYALYYITFSLTCGLRTVYLINLKNLVCVDIVKCQIKFCLLPDFLHSFLKKLGSTGGPHEISQRAAGWTALIWCMVSFRLSLRAFHPPPGLILMSKT